MSDLRSAALALFLGLSLFACQSETPAIVGSWKADVDAMAKAMGQDPSQMPPDARAMLADLIRMEVKADGTFSIAQKNPMAPSSEPDTVGGTWNHVNGDHWRMTGKNATTGQEDSLDARVEDGKLICTKEGAAQALVLIRAN